MIGYRPMTLEDVPFVNAVRNEYAMEFLHDKRTFTVEETTEWFNATAPMFWMITFHGQLTGYFRLSNHKVKDKSIYIGADIAPAYAGKGLATAAYREFMPYIARLWNIKYFYLEVLHTNQRAIHLYRKLGFVTVGTTYKTASEHQLKYLGPYSHTMILDIDAPGSIEVVAIKVPPIKTIKELTNENRA